MTKRIGVIEFLHESNTFTINQTELEDFRASWYFTGQDVLDNLRGTNTTVGGCIDAAARLDLALFPTIAVHAEPGGPVNETTRRTITDDALTRLRKGAPYDGLFISFHGSMVTETSQDGETQFLTRVREVVGDIPIAITLDLHANISDKMTDLVDIVVSYRTYPHVDMREVGNEACSLLAEALNGDTSPKVVISRPPMLVGCDDGRTTNDGPMCQILELAKREMRAPAVLNVAVNAGFTDADVYDAGPSVLVTYDRLRGSGIEASAVADRVCDLIWKLRDIWSRPMDLSDCIEQLLDQAPNDKPVVIADFSDNPGSGAYSDCTALLSALINAGVENAALGALYDPDAAAELSKIGVGAEITLTVGGKTDPAIGGGPIELTGIVQAVSDGAFNYEGPMYAGVSSTMGQSVCFRTKGIDVVISSARVQMRDLNIFRAVGIEPSEKSLLVVKSMQHFRGAFAPIASKILVTDAGGLCSPNVALRRYENLRRPVFPLDIIDA